MLLLKSLVLFNIYVYMSYNERVFELSALQTFIQPYFTQTGYGTIVILATKSVLYVIEENSWTPQYICLFS